MRARYENDPARGAGYGLLHVEDAGIDGTEVSFAVIRSGDHKYLHPESWEDTEYRLTPNGVTRFDSGLCLTIGPGIVRQLDELNTYRFMLFPAAGETLKAPLELSGIIYPPEDGMGRVGIAQAVRAAPVSPSEPPPAQEPEPESAAPQPLPPVKAKKSFPVWLIVLLLLLAGAGAWFMQHGRQVETPVAETKAEPAKEEAGKEKSQSAQPVNPEQGNEEIGKEEPESAVPVPAQSEEAIQTPITPEPLAPLEQARQFLRGNGPAAAGLALSRTLPQTPEGRDAAYLLLEAAAEQGESEAMLGLADFYDPLGVESKGSILPDAALAWEWYGKAEKAGQVGAANRKRALHAWLEAEAGKGSAAARDILSRIR